MLAKLILRPIPYLIKQRKVNECIINLTNRILQQAAYFWMSEAEIMVTNNLCAQRMHYTINRRNSDQMNVCVNVRTCVSNNACFSILVNEEVKYTAYL